MLDVQPLAGEVVDQSLDRQPTRKAPPAAPRRRSAPAAAVAAGGGAGVPAAVRAGASPSARRPLPFRGRDHGGIHARARRTDAGRRFAVGERAHRRFLREIMHRLLVALAHFDQIRRQLAAGVSRCARYCSKSPPCRRMAVANLSSFSSRSRMSLSCSVRELPPVGEVAQPHVLRAEADENLVQLRVVVHVLLALAALDLVKRRLRDVDVAAAGPVRPSAGRKTSAAGADVRAVHVGIGHDDDAAVAQLFEVERTLHFARRRSPCRWR